MKVSHTTPSVKKSREKLVIPKIIHQTYSHAPIPERFQEAVENLKTLNPDWEYRFYDNQDRENYIASMFDEEMLRVYRSINPSYGAARADFFRYLVLYKEGGVYLDIKSTCKRPFSEVIWEEDEFIISNWPSDSDEFRDFGYHHELVHIEGGEFQQWCIFASPNSVFLKAVIEGIVDKIKNYSPWRDGVGRRGVLRTTGPIMYTLAIYPLLSSHKHRFEKNHLNLGLVYSIFDHPSQHRGYVPNHYTKNRNPIIIRDGFFARVSDVLYKIFH